MKSPGASLSVLVAVSSVEFKQLCISWCRVYKEAKFKVLIFFKKTVFLFALVLNS